MNILIPYKWLKEYLETQARPEKIGECLSLCGASVEKINKVGNDSVFDIEITTNRVDMMSVLGIAREAATILPQFGIKAKLKKDPYKNPKSTQKIVSKIPGLKVIIKNKSLCPRFTAVILKNVKIGPSPKIVQKRLTKAGMRPINNIIDISNYLMHELGQPVHTFDYGKIKKQTIILRESKKGEEVVTLDGKVNKLAGGDIVIEDGNGKLIDLCGIRGGKNSEIDKNTKEVLLFVQTYEPHHIRQTSMSLGQRTEAAALFEKDVDSELVMPTLLKGIQLIKQNAKAQVASKIIDIYPHQYKPKKVKVSLQLIEQYLGLPVQLTKVKNILTSLGFSVSSLKRGKEIEAAIPSWRAKDVNIAEDLIEEIARIYGYHNLPSVLPPLHQQPKKSGINFDWENRIKHLLKNWGLTETYTYSMQSEEELVNFNLDPKKHLKIKNPLSSEWLYMRTNLLASLLPVIKQNLGLKKEINLFEISNVYLPKKGDLPNEKLKLAIILTGDRFSQLKGMIEALLFELGVDKIVFSSAQEEADKQWGSKTAAIRIENKSKLSLLGLLGELNPTVINNFEVKEKVVAAYLDFELLLKLATKIKKYNPIAKYPPIIEDLTFVLAPKATYAKLLTLISSISSLIRKIEFIGLYKNSLSLRIFYQHSDKNLTDKEISKIREKIIKKVKVKDLGSLKG